LTQSTHAGIDDPGDPRPSRRSAPSTGVAVVAALLIVLLVLSLIAGGYLVYRLNNLNDEPLNPLSGAPAAPSEEERKTAVGVAEQFALRMDNVDGSDFDGYIKSVNELLTTKAKAKNNKVFDVMQQSYETAKVTGKGKILVSGVAELDDDSAIVLVAHDASVKTTQGNVEHHYRWTVDLAKVDGNWLVDDFNPVN